MYKAMYNNGEIENVVEEVVFEEIHHAIIANGQPTFCHCSVCIQDVACIVLNNVDAKYESNYLEKNQPRPERVAAIEAIRQQVKAKLAEAVGKVQQTPHH